MSCLLSASSQGEVIEMRVEDARSMMSECRHRQKDFLIAQQREDLLMQVRCWCARPFVFALQPF